MAAPELPRRNDDRSISELVSDLSEQTSHLVRDEIRLARAELSDKAAHARAGAGYFGAAGLLAFFATAALVTAGIAALALVLDVWAAAAIVAVVLLGAALAAALVGRGEVRKAGGKPERTVTSVKRDLEEVGRR